MVNDHFEQDLESAIIQSKLDYENQKKSNNNGVVVVNKKKKSKTMCLSEFLEGPENTGILFIN